MKHVAVIKLTVGTILIINALQQVLAYKTWWFIQNVNLIFHEAGHVLFMFFGEFMHILGGSLLEILIPLLVTIHFVRSKQLFSAGCTSWWMATAFLSVSIYASDANERLLPLITRDVSTHDWYNLLLMFNLLKYDDLFGYLFILGSLMSIALIGYFLSKDKDIKYFLSQVNQRSNETK